MSIEPTPESAEPVITTHNSSATGATAPKPSEGGQLPVAPKPGEGGSTPHSTHRRVGKVARLPKVIRDKLNAMIMDGVSYAEIIRNLGEEGQALNEVNLCHWKAGGYQDWLDEQSDLAEMRLREEYAFELVKQNEGTTLNEATIKMATAQIRGALRAVGSGTLQTALEGNPDNYVRLLHALARLTAGAITCQHHRVKEAERTANLQETNTDPAERVVRKETLGKIEEMLHLR